MPTSPVDIAIEYNSDLEMYDLVIEGGQFKTVTNFDTALNMSLLCERRADSSEMPQPERRRGWWGNRILQQVADYETGSKLCLLEQARRTPETLQVAIDYTKKSLEWFIEDNHLSDVRVRGELTGANGIRLYIDLVTFLDKVESKYFDLWNNTGYDVNAD